MAGSVGDLLASWLPNRESFAGVWSDLGFRALRFEGLISSCFAVSEFQLAAFRNWLVVLRLVPLFIVSEDLLLCASTCIRHVAGSEVYRAAEYKD